MKKYNWAKKGVDAFLVQQYQMKAANLKTVFHKRNGELLETFWTTQARLLQM